MKGALELRTNAKINLFLRVRGRRPDGYHEIETIFHTVGLADSIAMRTTSARAIEVDLSSEGDVAGLPSSENNLVRLVAQRLIGSAPTTSGAQIEVLKRIPIGAGLGGGSGNAAGALTGLNELWGLGLDRASLERIALEVGADVPYCLTGGTALATGRGEEITVLPAPVSLSVVLGISHQPLLTRAVYAAFDLERDSDAVQSAPMSLALGSGDVGEVAALMHNDLERPAFRLRPELAKLKQAMLDTGALGTLMSGSGPTIIAVARDQDHAAGIAGAVEPLFDRVVVTSSRPQCIERLG
ncbi:MAG: 4-(cytidine 5'-diphospho)-2-C-methyl-D-erythritol kinase [Actinomycetota bacterium]